MVGKSTIAETFAKNNFESYILIDFENASNNMLAVFDDIANLDIFFLRLQAEAGVNLVKHESCIIFKEIELAPKVRQAIKYLVKDGRYSYIETGSFLNIKRHTKDIVIPSEEMKINVYPMDYEEFCWATGYNYDKYQRLIDCGLSMGDELNRKLMRDFRIYMAVGGMPQAVEAYVNKENFEKIDMIKKGIISLYMDDFRKIDSSGRISRLYNSIPDELSNNKNRFVMSRSLGKQRITEDDLRILTELIDSKTVLPCYNVTDPSILLSLNTDDDSFKLYLSDIGLFTTMILNNKELINGNLYSKLLSDKLDANLGYLYENTIAQIIASTNNKLFFHTWRENQKSHSYEIDFLLSDNAKLVPIEVKSSSVRNHRSINEFSKKYSSRVSRRILFSQDTISHEEMLELIPIYLAPIVIDKFK